MIARLTSSPLVAWAFEARNAALLMLAAVLFTLGGAWFIQLVLGIQPCPLCLEQRIPYYASLPLLANLILQLRQEKVFVARTSALWGLILLAIAIAGAMGAYHAGVEWDALQQAYERNQRAEQRVQAQQKVALERYQRAVERAKKRGRPLPEPPNALNTVPKVVGGSTITQQLAKNLFLSKERNFVRKGQEFVITFMLEGLLSKDRILDIYLNNVEWGEGVFGIEAASQHYFRTDADRLSPYQAARLAVMLPAPKKFEKSPGSGYVMGRAATIAARMRAAELP